MPFHATTWRSLNHFFDDYKSISIRWRKASKKSERKENNILGDYVYGNIRNDWDSINARELFKNVSSQYNIKN